MCIITVDNVGYVGVEKVRSHGSLAHCLLRLRPSLAPSRPRGAEPGGLAGCWRLRPHLRIRSRVGARAAAPPLRSACTVVARTIGLHEYTRTHTHARTFLRAALCVLRSQALACMSPRRHAITFTWTARRRPGALTLSESSASVVPLADHLMPPASPMPAQIRPSCRGQRRGP